MLEFIFFVHVSFYLGQFRSSVIHKFSGLVHHRLRIFRFGASSWVRWKFKTSFLLFDFNIWFSKQEPRAPFLAIVSFLALVGRLEWAGIANSELFEILLS